MRIGFVLDGILANDSRVTNEAYLLADKGHQVFVLNFSEGKPMDVRTIRENVSSINVSFSKKKSNIFFALCNLVPLYDRLWRKDISRFTRLFGIEVLHAHDLYLARPAGMVAKEAAIPLVLDLHENYPAAIMNYRWAVSFPSRLIVRPRRWESKEKSYIRHADRVIVLSREYRKYLCEKYSWLNADSVFIYPNVPDFAKLSSFTVDKEIFTASEGNVILYFGVISRRRGINTAIEALKIVNNPAPRARLLLVGPVDKAEKKEFEKLFNAPGISEHLTHFPWKDISELPSYISASTLCISPLIRNPQHDSGIANKVFQYMMFGKPVIVSDCLPQVGLVEETGCGLVHKNGDAADLASKIDDLLSNPAKCILMGEKGRTAVKDSYNSRVKGQEIISLYNSLK